MKRKISLLLATSKGFTLIELLVVIAIIGILASVLLVNFSNTQKQAKDSAIKLEMSQIIKALEIFYSNNNSYVNGCAAGTTDCGKLRTDIVDKGGKVPSQRITASAFCLKYTLNQSNTTYWCVDSTGYAGPPATFNTCNATGKCL